MADSATKEVVVATKTASEQRGIPKAIFVEDVNKTLQASKTNGGSQNCTEMLEAYDKTYQNYKMMEESLLSKQRRLRSQVKDIKSTLSILDHMASKKDDPAGVTTDFRLADALWAKAHIPKTEKVSLWLGANVMLEYDIEEAQTLLTTNRDQAKVNLAQIDEDTDFLRDQTTTTEVNMARIYNYDVTERRKTGGK